MALLVEDVMTRSVTAVPPGAPLAEVARLMVELGVSGLPIVAGDGTVVGVVSETDLLEKGRWLVDRLDISQRLVFEVRVAGEAMTSPAVTVRPDCSLVTAARRMLAHQVNRLPVVAGGTLVGIVTRSDLLRGFSLADAVAANGRVAERILDPR
ncbi:MAG TPA: CBS domain-containing protein [Gaiellaceae bacterium]|nr:CBS domain-containing protein [Gaiellaceae bacterium]